MNKYIVVFCEGDHDINFLSRLLYIDGFTKDRTKVKNFRKPLDELYSVNLGMKKLDDIRFEYQGINVNVPYTILKKDDVSVIFHNLNGDGNMTNGTALEIVNMYLELNDEARLKIEKYSKFNFRFLYFLDADNEGITKRETDLNEFLDIKGFVQNKIFSKEDYEVGCSIFYDEKDKNTYGKLEDILLSIMKPNNEVIFEKSKQYITENIFCGENKKRQKKFKCNSKEEEHIESIQFKEQKSIISIAGQLQFSGANNSVIIANSDYITKADILSNNACRDIMKLFRFRF